MNRIDIARLFLYVREKAGEQNRGLRVEAIQHWSQGQFGDSWCDEFVTMVLDLEWQGECPLPRGGSCQTTREQCEKLGYIVTEPEPGDLYFYVNAEDHAHHVGFVTEVDPLVGIAGNTDATGTSNNGDRVAEHAITTKGTIVFARVPAAA